MTVTRPSDLVEQHPRQWRACPLHPPTLLEISLRLGREPAQKGEGPSHPVQGQSSSPHRPAMPRRMFTFFLSQNKLLGIIYARLLCLPQLTASPCAQAFSHAGHFIGCPAPSPSPQANTPAMRQSCCYLCISPAPGGSLVHNKR